MKKRLITAAVLLTLLLPLVILDHQKYKIVGILFLIVGVLFSMIASYEMISMFCRKHETVKIYRFLMGIFSGLIVLAIHFSDKFSYPIDLLLFLFIVLAIMLITIFTKNSTAYDMMAGIITVVYCGLMLGYVINIRYLEPFPSDALIYLRGGRSFGYLYAIVAATDSFAFLFGMKFGKRRLAPTISPKKSVEGAIAGLIGGSIVGVLAIFVFKIANYTNPTQLILIIIIGFFLSMFISFMVQIGDLVASKMKRTFEIKDFGNIFPGHGGVIDRFDSLIYAGTAYYIIVQVLEMLLTR